MVSVPRGKSGTTHAVQCGNHAHAELVSKRTATLYRRGPNCLITYPRTKFGFGLALALGWRRPGPAWGPLTPSGIKGMHYGDMFYAAVGLMVYLHTWPDQDQAKEWPMLGSFVGSWASVVLLRNLL